jgi:ubiquinone/menaquinone biosynthesis C-methylase UbiE
VFDLDEYRQNSRQAWGQVAAGWEDRREWMMALTALVNDWIVDNADPRPGQTFLEVAGGTGDLGHLVAGRVGPEGRVLYTDFAPEMVDVARRQGEARGVQNVEYRVLDAERMELGDDSVDGVVCRYGYMLMADPVAALRETRRVLRDGGPLSFAVWATADRNPWAAIPAMTMVQRGHLPPPDPTAPGIFAMGRPERIREVVAEAGFAEPRIEEIPFEYRYADADDLWDAITKLAGSLARALRAMPDDERAAAEAAVVENMASYRNPDGSYAVPAASWGVLTR